MNKYAKAWNILITELTKKNYTVGGFLARKPVILIQELVEKATLKPPILEESMYFCPTCDSEVYNMNYCAHCGQGLELSTYE